MKDLITSPLFYMMLCLSSGSILIYFNKLTTYVKYFFVIWFLISYFLMTSIGSNFLVKSISVNGNHSSCSGSFAVLLANGMTRFTSSNQDYGALSIESINRVHAARKWLLNDSANRLLISGTRANYEAEILFNYLVLIGIPADRLKLDDSSHTTYESAVNLRKQREINQSVVLITSQIHMRRAALSFKKNGFKVCKKISHNQFVNVSGFSAFMPNSFAIEKSEKVLHELFGILWYYYTDRLD